MILGITRDVIAADMAELFRAKLATILRVPGSAVTCTLRLENGKIIPKIEIDGDAAEGLSPDQIREVIASVWKGVPPLPGIREMFIQRLLDMRSRRVRPETQKAS